MGQNNIIELNGKQYDAITGALLGDGKAAPAAAPRTGHRGRVIDGFIKQPAGQASTVVKPTAKPVSQTTAKGAPTKRVMELTKVAKKPVVARNVPKHAKPHQPERAKTLMRHVVAKPKTSLKPAIKTQPPTEMAPARVAAIAPKLEIKKSVKQVDPGRAERAKRVVKSQHIRRFPALHAGPQAAAALPHRAQTQQSRPAPTATAVRTAIPVQRPTIGGQATTAVRPQSPPAPQHTDIFEAAIAHAVSHQQPAHKPRRKLSRLAGITASVATFLIVGGFIAYANLPSIELRMASMRAGFSAQMPDYRPTGFALSDPIESSKGKVVMRFASGDSSYTITQEASDWDSRTLLDNKVATTDPHHQTIESQGRIIFIYNKSNATWVDGGVRYEVNSNNGALDSNEIVELATSM